MTNPIEIVFKDTQETAMFACGTCGCCTSIKDYGDKARELSEQCCSPPVCFCGQPREKHSIRCEKCRAAHLSAEEKKRFDAAEKLAEQPSDCGMIYMGDEYYTDWDDFLCGCEKPEDVPEYAYATETVKWTGLCVDNILERANEEYNVEDQSIEDHLTDVDVLTAFIMGWNARQNVHWYESDFTRVILRPADYLTYFPEVKSA